MRKRIGIVSLDVMSLRWNYYQLGSIHWPQTSDSVRVGFGPPHLCYVIMFSVGVRLTVQSRQTI